ncbi:hypothetical protein N7504_003435 [Penicillium tannophilum]|nr:hypothetical protein N7504_003435 [Penicillium tannophilum]
MYELVHGLAIICKPGGTVGYCRLALGPSGGGKELPEILAIFVGFAEYPESGFWISPLIWGHDYSTEATNTEA